MALLSETLEEEKRFQAFESSESPVTTSTLENSSTTINSDFRTNGDDSSSLSPRTFATNSLRKADSGSKKEPNLISKRSLRRVQKLRSEFHEKTLSATSFTVLTDSSRNETGTSLLELEKIGSSQLKREREDFEKTLQELSNPFLYQMYHETESHDIEKGSRIQQSSSALELEDFGKILRKQSTPDKYDEGSTSTSSKNASATEESTSPTAFEFPEGEEAHTKAPKGFKLRWFNMLGIILLGSGIISLAVVEIVKHVVETRKPLPPVISEKLSDYVYPTLSALRTSLVDPDTPKEFRHKESAKGEMWDLVFSDEFNLEGRTFYPKEDQFFEAVDIHYLATNDLEWYDPDLITTANGTLNIRLDAIKSHHLFYRSGMLQSWNKMCFTQGLVEISARLPGSFESKGFWPGLWSLGNLARPGYIASTDGVWPYTYQECDAGITPNQSSPDGLSSLPGQRLNSCTCLKEDHPNRGTGRGAPEIDILEGTFTKDLATVAQTFQMAPFDPWWLPDYRYMSITNKTTSYLNSYVGTSQQEAVSVITTLNETWFEKIKHKKHNKEIKSPKNNFQTYSVEFRSDQKKREENYISFGTGDRENFRIEGSMLHPEGNIGWREISKEPMSIVFNLGLSYAWSDIQWMSLQFPATLEIDYIRIYQPRGKESVTCDPESHPTTNYIEDHLNAYMNPNLTSWSQAGYEFPKNRLVNNCY